MNRSLSPQALQKLQQGAKKHFTKTFSFEGTDYKPADLQGVFQKMAEAGADTESKRADYHEAVAAQAKATDDARSLILAFRQQVFINFGSQASVPADFGLTPRKRRELSVKEKAAAQDKATATRDAGGQKVKASKAEPPVVAPATVPPASGVTTNGVAAPVAPAAKPSGTGN